MKNSKQTILILAIAAVALVGFFTLDLQSNQASVVRMPDFDTQVEAAEDQSIASLKDFNDAIANIAEKTIPTVVTVSTSQTVRVPENPFSRFFGQPGEEREIPQQGLGSGVIVSNDGYILTNNHVVEGADEIYIATYDNNEFEAEIVGTDPLSDIAVLKVNAENMPSINFGDSDALRVGEMALAIGSPFGDNLAHSVSMGIISAKERVIGVTERTGGFESFIQTDAAINPGNSGGALINTDGDLVGINTAIASRSGGNQGVGFAIPVNRARNIMDQLIETGEVARGRLGISMGGEVDRTMARALGLDKPQGIIIGGVQQDTPAQEAGLKEGDVIITLNGEPVYNMALFRTEIANTRPGTEVTLGIITEDGEETEVQVELGEMDDDALASSGNAPDGPSLDESLGFTVDDLDSETARRYRIENGEEGVVVTRISPNSRAYREGLREGDLITSVARQRVENTEQFNEIMSELTEQGDAAVLLRVLRNGNGQFIAFEVG